MTQNEINEINAWLSSSRGYTEGVQLFERFSSNRSLKLLFPRKEKKYATKLAYELSKLILKKPEQDLPPAPAKPKPSALKPVAKEAQSDECFPPIKANQPPIIRRIISEFSELYKNRSMAHASLKAIPPDNRPENVELRRIIVEKMAGWSSRMDELNAFQEDYRIKDIIPDESLVYPVIKPEVLELTAENLDQMKRRLANLKKSVSRDNCLLNFGKNTKQPILDEMRPGTRRTKIERNIRDHIAEINKLTTQIDGFSKILGA
ncbi:MAG: hypothetical protein WC699_13080 [Bacteroidales bacterium]|jgi:hypothetical protein